MEYLRIFVAYINELCASRFERTANSEEYLKMSDRRSQILETIESLIETRDIIFTQIVNLAMSGEMKHIENAFDIGDEYSFELAHFEDIEDINVQKLISLCKKTEETVFSLMNLNGINENEVSL